MKRFAKHYFSNEWNIVWLLLYSFMNIIIYIKEPESSLAVAIFTNVIMALVILRSFLEFKKDKKNE